MERITARVFRGNDVLADNVEVTLQHVRYTGRAGTEEWMGELTLPLRLAPQMERGEAFRLEATDGRVGEFTVETAFTSGPGTVGVSFSSPRFS